MDKTICKIGYRSGLVAFGAASAFVIVQLLQLLRMISYPTDEILIYATSLCIVIPFLLELLALHYFIAEEKRFWSHAAILFGTLYAVFVTANYAVQLATVIPTKIRGSSQDIRLLEQTPHSMFWDFDALGYIFMGLATLVAVPLFEKNGFQKWVRASFIANALVTPLISVVYFYPEYSEKLLVLGFPWATTAPLAMLLLAIMFKKQFSTGE